MKKLFVIASLLLSAFVFGADEDASSLNVSEENLIAAVEVPEPTFVSIEALGPGDENYIDQHILRDFIESRGLIACRQKSGLLTIAGDARARWSSTIENVNHQAKRGVGTGTPVNIFKSEVNLFFDYETDRAWASTKLRWANIDGRDGGTPTKVEMDRAFIGYDFYNCGPTDFYLEVGRSRLDFMFESRVEFTSIFDGIHLYYTNCWPSVCTFIAHGGPFVGDAYSYYFPWVAEFFFKELGGTDWGIKYSIIDWNSDGSTRKFGKAKDSPDSIKDNPRYRFTISQLILGYQSSIDFLRCKTFYGYAAVLANTAAKKNVTTNFEYLNKAWYIGFTLGKLCKACDWSWDLNYQYVQAQAIPEFDLSGIGHGNVGGDYFSDAIINGFGPGIARGFTNYKGWSTTFLFAMTDSLSLRAVAQESRPCDKSIGGEFHYASFEMSVIYAW